MHVHELLIIENVAHRFVEPGCGSAEDSLYMRYLFRSWFRCWRCSLRLSTVRWLLRRCLSLVHADAFSLPLLKHVRVPPVRIHGTYVRRWCRSESLLDSSSGCVGSHQTSCGSAQIEELPAVMPFKFSRARAFARDCDLLVCEHTYSVVIQLLGIPPTHSPKRRVSTRDCVSTSTATASRIPRVLVLREYP